MYKKLKRFLLVALLASFSMHMSSQEPSDLDALKVMTFNIRMETEEDEGNMWMYRTELVEPFLRDQNPDLIGAQEVLYGQLVDLKSMLPDYGCIGVGREDGMKKGEFAPILYNKNKLFLLESSYFWLSETPERPSFGWDAACERIVTWALFKRISDDRQILFVNTHFDHQGEVARKKSAEMIKKLVSKWSSTIPVIVVGDFNSVPSSPVILSLGEQLKDSFVQAESKEGTTWTFHDFGRLPINERHRIDYIFYCGGLVPLSYTNFDQPSNVDDNIWLSDHTPVVTTFRID